MQQGLHRNAPAVDAPAPEPRPRLQPLPLTPQSRPLAPPHALQLQHLWGEAVAYIPLHAVHGLGVQRAACQAGLLHLAPGLAHASP